ncbi:MAG: DUF5711 family protein [Clostridiales bacterium]|nr:DUF5711 family protein [Clostridiales bacterium]
MKKEKKVKEERAPLSERKKAIRRKKRFRLVLRSLILLVVIFTITFVTLSLLGSVRFSNITECFTSFFAMFKKGDGYPYTVSYSNIKTMDMLGKNPVIVENNSIYVLNANAGKTVEEDHSYLDPALRVNNGRILMFDRASDKFMVLTSNSKLYDYQAGKNLITAAISRSGYVAFATGADNACSVLNVLDTKKNLVFAWRCADEYISDIAFASDNRLAVSVIGVKTARAYSKVVVLDMNKDSAAASFEFPDTSVFDIEYISGKRLEVIGDNLYSIISRDLSGKTDTAFAPYKLSNAAKHKRSLALSVSELDGGTHILKLFNGNGKMLFEKSIEEGVDDISVYGSSTAVLQSGKVTVFNSRGNQVSTVDVGKNVYRIKLAGSRLYVFSVNEIRTYGV